MGDPWEEKKRLPREKATKKTGGSIPQPQLPQSINGNHPSIAFRFADTQKYTIYDLQLNEIHLFFGFFKKLEDRTWQQVLETGGKKEKTGLAYTPFQRSQLPTVPSNISPDVLIFELRVDGKMRVFAFRIGDVCNIVWFDRNHDIGG